MEKMILSERLESLLGRWLPCNPSQWAKRPPGKWQELSLNVEVFRILPRILIGSVRGPVPSYFPICVHTCRILYRNKVGSDVISVR